MRRARLRNDPISTVTCLQNISIVPRLADQNVVPCATREDIIGISPDENVLRATPIAVASRQGSILCLVRRHEYIGRAVVVCIETRQARIARLEVSQQCILCRIERLPERLDLGSARQAKVVIGCCDSLRWSFRVLAMGISPVELFVFQNIGTMLGEHAVGLLCLHQGDVGRVVVEPEHLGFIIAALRLSPCIS